MNAKQATQAPPKAPAPIDWVEVIGSAFVLTAFQWLAQAIVATQAPRPVETQPKYEHPFATAEADAEAADEMDSNTALDEVEAAALLGVSVDASEDEIRAALRARLASSRIHPDQGGDGEEAKRVIAAKNLLVERKRGVRR